MTKRFFGLVLVAVSGLGLVGQAFASGIDTPNPNLPPAGVYLSPDQVHAMYNGGALQVVLSAIQHRPFGPGGIHQVPGSNNETEDFSSSLDGQISVNGSPNTPTHAQGPVTTEVFGKFGQTTGTFQTEMLAMSLNGNAPVPYMIRESPTLASTGQVSITDIGGGMYHIDSFFDVFTELSVDGGNSWIPSTGSAHVVLQSPEPATVALAGLAIFGLAAVRRRRR